MAASLRDGEGRPRMVEGRRPTREDVQAELELLSGKEAILLPEAGEVHHDRFLAPLGLDADGKPVYALADPVAALDRLRALTPDARRAAEERIRNLAPGTDAADPRLLAGLLRVTPEVLTAARTSPVVRHLTTIEQLLRHRGIRVERVPALPKRLRSGDGETVFQSPFGLYYTNMLQDSVATPNGIFRSVHFPSYGLPALEERVEEIYRRYFDEIHPLPAVVEGVSGAGPRCMVKVFGVPLPAPTPPAAPAPPPPGR